MRKLTRLTALLTALVLALTACPAMAEDATLYTDARVFDPMLYVEDSLMHLLTEEQLTAIAQLKKDDVHAIVEAMFTAAAGVKEYDEIQLWKELNAKEEAVRSEENAAYRAKTLGWLVTAFAPGYPPEEAVELSLTADRIPPTRTPMPTATPAPTATPDPAITPDPNATPEPTPEPEWTLADGVAAFEGNELGQAFLELLKPLGGEDAETYMAVTQAVCHMWLRELDHDRFTEINEHYQCWLYAPSTPIDYPVVQCRNNDYYLSRLFDRTSNPAGTLFIDYRNLPDFEDPNTLIYGHHMRDNSMFHSLTDYETPGYFEAHPFMLVVEAEYIHVVEVFAGYVTDSSDHCYDIAISDEEDMRRFVNTAAKKSDFDSHVEVNCKKDHLVTLSTCAYHFDNARYIVIGRLTNAWEQVKTYTPVNRDALPENEME